MSSRVKPALLFSFQNALSDREFAAELDLLIRALGVNILTYGDVYRHCIANLHGGSPKLVEVTTRHPRVVRQSVTDRAVPAYQLVAAGVEFDIEFVSNLVL